ncbi:hypothetical protein IWZ01DRAFT_155306 [Phyllosticta capitalensis]
MNVGGSHREVRHSRSHKNGVFWERNFTFSELVVDESSEQLDEETKESVDALGEIVIKVFRVKVTSTPEPVTENSSKPFAKLHEDSEVPEKALKGRAVSHKAELGQLQKGQAYSRLPSLERIDESDAPYAVFKFRYRSAEALKSMHLMPRTPEPVPLEERPIEELTSEEMRELLRRQRERPEQTRAMKREARDETVVPKLEPGQRSQWEDGDDLAVIERPTKRHRNNSDEPIETVDLTGD